MTDEKKQIINLIILILFIIIDSYLFSLTNITLFKITTINLFPLIDLILTFEFITFIIFCCFTLAILAHIITFNSKTNLNIIIIPLAYFTGIIIGTIIFQQTQFIIILLFGIIGIIFVIKQKNIMDAQLQIENKLNYFKIGSEIINKIILFTSIGLFIVVLITSSSNQNSQKEFLEDFMKISIGDQASLKETLKAPLIDSIVSGQIQTIESIKSLPNYYELKNKNDADVLTFITNFEAFESTIKSKNYKDTLLSSYENQTNINLENKILEQIPFIEKISNYSWLIYSIMGFILFSFIGGIIVKNLGAIIYFIIAKTTHA